jgi:hypothetical protein
LLALALPFFFLPPFLGAVPVMLGRIFSIDMF